MTHSEHVIDLTRVNSAPALDVRRYPSSRYIVVQYPGGELGLRLTREQFESMVFDLALAAPDVAAEALASWERRRGLRMAQPPEATAQAATGSA